MIVWQNADGAQWWSRLFVSFTEARSRCDDHVLSGLTAQKNPRRSALGFYRVGASASHFAALIRSLVSIVIWLVGSFHRYANVVGLFLSQGGEFYTELGKVKSRNLFVKSLGQHVDLGLVDVGLSTFPEL